MLWLTMGIGIASSWACGGFFCDATVLKVPVEQTAERILFVVNPDDTVTTFVEVSYQRTDDVDFAWVIPIPEPIPVDDIDTASADLLNELEVATAPRFRFLDGSAQAVRGGGVMACGADDGGTDAPPPPDTPVQVVGEAVVGPFAIEVITATDAEAFAAWLDKNEYLLPDGAIAPLEHYVDLDMAFLGVKLAPDAPDGPIDTLQFTYPSTAPMIPLILTAIASADDLPIITYVLSDEPFAPANWAVGADVAPGTRPWKGGTDYLDRVAIEIDSHAGQAFVLEYAQRTNELPALSEREFDRLVGSRRWLTRWRGDISPHQMVLDPMFGPAPDLAPYSNLHLVDLTAPTEASAVSGWGLWLVPPLVLLAWSRRRD